MASAGTKIILLVYAILSINGSSDSCVNCSAINDFKAKIKVELEPEL